jgi:hypothetical protein
VALKNDPAHGRGFSRKKWGSQQAVPDYTLATLPSAAANAGRLVRVTNAAGGPTLCISDGANWKIVAAQGATVA